MSNNNKLLEERIKNLAQNRDGITHITGIAIMSGKGITDSDNDGQPDDTQALKLAKSNEKNIKNNTKNITKNSETIEILLSSVVTDLGLNNNNDLVILHDGTQISGQTPLALKEKFALLEATSLTNQDLDTLTEGKYYAGGSNSVAHKPTNVDAFGLFHIRNASGRKMQLLFPSNQSTGKVFVRHFNSSKWTDWEDLTAIDTSSLTFKTLFGNQNILGSGNIDLYRHNIKITDSNGLKVYVQYTSSKNLKVDSITDLNTLIKDMGVLYVNASGSLIESTGYSLITGIDLETATPRFDCITHTTADNTTKSELRSFSALTLEDTITTI